jgi:hypothetical protein
MSDGVIHYRHGFGSLALTVRQGRVVECEPPREWPIGESAADFWANAKTLGVDLAWKPNGKAEAAY